MDTRFRHVAIIVAAIVAVSGTGLNTQARRPFVERADTFGDAGAEARLQQIVRLVERSNVPGLIGPSRWRRILQAHREAIERCDTHERFRRAINRLFSHATVSHFRYYIDDEWPYWLIRSTFDDDDEGVAVYHVGLFTQRIEGRWFVRGVLEGSPIDGKNVDVGDEVISVDGLPFSPIESFRISRGRPVTIRLRRKPSLIVNVRVTPVRESLYAASQRAMEESIRVVRHGGLRLAYLHAWTLLGAGREYDTLLELQGRVDGLLLDYRDGYGGTWDKALRFLLGERRGAKRQRRDPGWHKPVVILIADGTRSAKEIVVDAARRAGRAPLVGTATPGDVMSVGAVRSVGSDGLLMLPGSRFDLEGKPTPPDFFVARDIRYCAGADAQMDAAKRVLADLIYEARAAAPSAAARGE